MAESILNRQDIDRVAADRSDQCQTTPHSDPRYMWWTHANAVGACIIVRIRSYSANQMSRKKTESDYASLARAKDDVFVGPLPATVHERTNWRCENGHIFATSHVSLRQSRGNGCPHCSGKAQHTDADYHGLAKRRGIRWLGPYVLSALAKTNWECGKGHPPFSAAFSTLYRPSKGNGCQLCAGNIAKTEDAYHDLAQLRGMYWLGPNLPPNVGTPTKWRCAFCDHIWRASYGNISSRGSGCPKCVDIVNGHRVSRPQRALCGMLDGTLNKAVDRYVVDVAVEVGDCPIAVEYDAWYWHAAKLAEDDERDNALVAARWRVLRIRSNTLLPDIYQLNNAIDQLIAGEKRVEIVLSDWGGGRAPFPGRRARRNTAAQTRSQSKGLQITEKACACVGEIDRRYMHIRSGTRGLARIRLSPAESRVFAFELGRCTSYNDAIVPKPLIFTYASVRAALNQRKRRNEATGSMMARLRGLVEFANDGGIGLVDCQTRGRFSTTIAVRQRLIEPGHETIQTAAREWRPFVKARAFARKLRISTQLQWHQWAKSPERPADIPSNPQRTYRGKGWTNWGEWLGNKI
jgi:very-short-patch-repair endonuclease